MVRVFSRILNLVLTLLLGSVLFSSISSYADTGEKSILQREAQRAFQKRRQANLSNLESWKQAAASEADAYVLELRTSKIKINSLQSIQASENVTGAVFRDKKAMDVIKQPLDIKAMTKKGWKENFKDLYAALDRKNLSLLDLKEKSTAIKDFLKALSVEEKLFSKLLQKQHAQPITERSIEPTPVGSLAEGLKMLKVLSSFIDIQAEDLGDSELLRYFVAATAKEDAK